jgi:hypothetical protein
VAKGLTAGKDSETCWIRQRRQSRPGRLGKEESTGAYWTIRRRHG